MYSYAYNALEYIYTYTLINWVNFLLRQDKRWTENKNSWNISLFHAALFLLSLCVLWKARDLSCNLRNRRIVMDRYGSSGPLRWVFLCMVAIWWAVWWAVLRGIRRAVTRLLNRRVTRWLQKSAGALRRLACLHLNTQRR